MAEPSLEEVIRHHLVPHIDSKLLIVGGKPSNFPDEIRRNPRLIFWDSIDPETVRRQKIPAGVTAIVCTRFVDHAIVERINAIVPKGVKVIKGVRGTGQIRRAIATVLPDDEKENPDMDDANENGEPVGAHVMPLRKPLRGELVTFMRRQADLGVSKPSAEIDRLAELARHLGLQTTRVSISNSFFRLRRMRHSSEGGDERSPRFTGRRAGREREEKVSKPVDVVGLKAVFREAREKLEIGILAVDDAMQACDELIALEYSVRHAGAERRAQLEALGTEIERLRKLLSNLA
jgi:hypothetical protein